jgi:hypothetical protein
MSGLKQTIEYSANILGFYVRGWANSVQFRINDNETINLEIKFELLKELAADLNKHIQNIEKEKEREILERLKVNVDQDV